MSAAKCPICGKPPHDKFRPFCSRRCADVDLGRWFGEAYVVPSEEPVAAAGTGAMRDDEDDL